MARLADFRGIHYGEAIVVCGLGHSVLGFKDPQRFCTIGVNDIGRAFAPDYLLVMDKPESFGQERFQYIRESKARFVFTDHDLGLHDSKIVRFPIRRSELPKFDDPNGLYYTGRPPTSPYLALCLAAHMGAKAIGLIGVDFTNGHFFSADGAHKLERSLEGIDRRFYLLGSTLLDRGVKIFNLSKESRLAAFPRLSADEFYDLQRSGRTRSWSRPARRVCLYSDKKVNNNTARIARGINSQTLQSCRLIAPLSPDITSKSAPEVEQDVLVHSTVTIDCNKMRFPVVKSGNGFQQSWLELRPMLFERPRSLHANRDTRPLSMCVIVSQENATGEELAQTVRSLWPDLLSTDELVIIARNTDSAQIPGWLRNSSRFKYLQQMPGESWMAARNRVAALYMKDVLVFCDANVEAPPRWAGPLLKAFAAPYAAAVGPAVADMYEHRDKGFGMKWVDAELNTAWLAKAGDSPYPVPLLPGMFLAVRRSVFQNIGGFDQGMRGSGGDDVDLCFRIWTAGRRCMVTPNLEISWMNPFMAGAVRESDYWGDLLHNLLRLATIHFSPARLAAFVDKVRHNQSFPAAFEVLLKSDLHRERIDSRQKRKHSDKWFFRRFPQENA